MSVLNAQGIYDLKGKRKLTCLTAYTAPMAQLLGPHVDMLLVGDTVGMVLHGMDSTATVTREMMALHGKAVMRGVEAGDVGAFVIVDMPFGTYEQGADHALEHARFLIRETGAHAVKLEGGSVRADSVRALVQEGISVMGHIGLLPQTAAENGGYRVHGRSEREAAAIVEDAKALEAAGVFAIVIECVPDAVAAAVTAAVRVPVIGIGASSACDGQVLVSDDMLGLTVGRVPKFVKAYGDLGVQVSRAAAAFTADVRAGVFPSAAHVYGDR